MKLTDYSNYEFEYLFIPSVIEKNDKLSAFRNWYEIQTEIIMQDIEFDLSSFAITHRMQKGVEYFLLEFPKPEDIPEAYYGLIVNYLGKNPLYFTLEMSYENSACLCQVAIGKHINTGKYLDTISQENFIDEVFKYIDLHKDSLLVALNPKKRKPFLDFEDF